MSDPTFVQRLLEVQTKLKAPKGQYNKFGKYRYRSCEDILEALKPLLLDAGLLLSLDDEIMTVPVVEGYTEEDKGYHVESEQRVYVKATAPVPDGKASQSTHGYARESMAKKGMDASQVTGTASSYARKYALNGLFLIDDSKDDDTREPTDVPQKAGRRPQSNSSAQRQETPQIRDETPSEDHTREVMAAYQRIGDHKKEAIALGVAEGAMQAKITLMLGGRQFTDATLPELKAIDQYIVGLIADQKELKSGNQPSLY